jgi:uncharacterized protein YecT (DUF1311 family)
MTRKTAIALALLFLLSVASLAQSFDSSADKEPHIGKCWHDASTQLELNQCAGSDWKAADDEMNRVYKQVLDHYKQNRIAVEKIRKAQRAWVVFRDAQIEASYPVPDSMVQAQYGSMFPMCEAMQLTRLTLERTEQLKELIDGGTCGDTPPERPVKPMK